MKFLTIFLTAALLVGCTPRTTHEHGQQLADQLFYFKDRFGNCYAALPNATTSSDWHVSIAAVDCKRTNLQ
jgi:hypothetical protein